MFYPTFSSKVFLTFLSSCSTLNFFRSWRNILSNLFIKNFPILSEFMFNPELLQKTKKFSIKPFHQKFSLPFWVHVQPWTSSEDVEIFYQTFFIKSFPNLSEFMFNLGTNLGRAGTMVPKGACASERGRRGPRCRFAPQSQIHIGTDLKKYHFSVVLA